MPMARPLSDLGLPVLGRVGGGRPGYFGEVRRLIQFEASSWSSPTAAGYCENASRNKTPQGPDVVKPFDAGKPADEGAGGE